MQSWKALSWLQGALSAWLQVWTTCCPQMAAWPLVGVLAVGVVNICWCICLSVLPCDVQTGGHACAGLPLLAAMHAYLGRLSGLQ